MADEEVKGPDPGVWGEPEERTTEDEVQPEDLKGPNPDEWEVERDENHEAFAAAYEAEVQGVVMTKGPDPVVWGE